MLQQPGIVSGCNDSRGMTMSNLAIDIKHFSYTTTYKSQALNKVTQMPKNTITHQRKWRFMDICSKRKRLSKSS